MASRYPRITPVLVSPAVLAAAEAFEEPLEDAPTFESDQDVSVTASQDRRQRPKSADWGSATGLAPLRPQRSAELNQVRQEHENFREKQRIIDSVEVRELKKENAELRERLRLLGDDDDDSLPQSAARMYEALLARSAARSRAVTALLERDQPGPRGGRASVAPGAPGPAGGAQAPPGSRAAKDNYKKLLAELVAGLSRATEVEQMLGQRTRELHDARKALHAAETRAERAEREGAKLRSDNTAAQQKMQGYATEAAATVAKRAAEKRRTDALLKQVQTLQTGMIHVLDENQDPGQRATTIREVMRQNSSLYWKGVFDVKQRTLAELALKRLREEKGGARRVPRVLDRAEGRKEYAALDPQATAEDCDFASFLAVTRGEICFAYLAELDEAEQRRAVSFLAREFAGYVAWAARLDQLMEEVDALRFLTGMDIAKAHVHERAAGLLGCRRVIIWMVDAQEVWSVQSDPTTGLLNEVRLPFEGGYSPVLEALHARKPLRFERTGTAESMLFCPIFHGQQTVAILEAKGKQDDASFTSEDEFCMRVYGPAAAHLIRTQKEQESRKRDERRTQVFLETLKEMLRGLNREEDVMRLITQLLHDAYGAVRVAITVENAGNGLLRLEWDEDARRVHHAEVRKLGLGFGGLVAQAITDAASSFVPAGTNAPLHSRLADLDAESTQDLHTFPVLDRGIAFCVLQWTCPGSSRVHAAGKNFMHQNLQEAQRLQWMLQLFLPALKRLFPSEGMMKRVVLAARDAMARKQKALPPSHSTSQASPAPEVSPARRPASAELPGNQPSAANAAQESPGLEGAATKVQAAFRGRQSRLEVPPARTPPRSPGGDTFESASASAVSPGSSRHSPR